MPSSIFVFLKEAWAIVKLGGRQKLSLNAINVMLFKDIVIVVQDACTCILVIFSYVSQGTVLVHTYIYWRFLCFLRFLGIIHLNRGLFLTKFWLIMVLPMKYLADCICKKRTEFSGILLLETRTVLKNSHEIWINSVKMKTLTITDKKRKAKHASCEQF